MTFQDRPYYSGGGYSSGGGMAPMRSELGSRLTPIVKMLLIVNIGVFLLQAVLSGHNIYLEQYLAATTRVPGGWWQIWRLITFQFLHGSFGHLLGNMVSLYFFGYILERTWGSRKFLMFYLFCGFVGGVIFIVGSLITSRMGGFLVGASGGILGILAAGAILFPQITVILFPVPIPIRIRILVVFYLIWYLMNVVQGGANAGGDLCHLGGMAAAYLWIKAIPLSETAGVWLSRKKRVQAENTVQQLQFEVDRILAKVHEEGIHSLTKKEKQILQQATEQQRKIGV